MSASHEKSLESIQASSLSVSLTVKAPQNMLHSKGKEAFTTDHNDIMERRQRPLALAQATAVITYSTVRRGEGRGAADMPVLSVVARETSGRRDIT